MSVNAVVDYVNGYYNLISKNKGMNTSVFKAIRGRDNDMHFKANYSKQLMENRRKAIRDKAKKLEKEDPSFKLSEKALKKLDCVMYKALVDFDHRTYKETDYAKQFLKIVLNDYPGLSGKQLRNKRAEELEKAGINIAYNVGLLNAHWSMTLLDKIRGISIARKQKKFIGAKVKYNLIMNELYEMEDNSSKNQSVVNKAQQKVQVDEQEQLSKSKLNPIFGKEENDENEELLKEKSIETFRRIINKSKTTRSDVIRRVRLKTVQIKSKIHGVKDIIENKKYVQKKLKRYAIKGAVTLLSAGGILFATHNIGRAVKDSGNIKEFNSKYETEYTAPNIKKTSYGYVVISENETERQTETETEVQTEAITQKETEKQTEAKTEKQTETETEVQTEAETEVQTEAITQKETEAKKQAKAQTEKTKETETEVETQLETEKQRDSENKDQNETKKSKKQKMKEYKKQAKKICMDAFIVGEKPQIEDLLDGQTFSANPEGTGATGHIDKNPEYKIGHIEIVQEDGIPVKRDDLGKKIEDILAEYPDRLGYSIHLVDMNTGGGLGFITESQIEGCIQDKVKEIVQNKKAKNTKKSSKIVNIADYRGEER